MSQWGYITVALPLSDEQLAYLKRRVSRTYGSTIEIEAAKILRSHLNSCVRAAQKQRAWAEAMRSRRPAAEQEHQAGRCGRANIWCTLGFRHRGNCRQ